MKISELIKLAYKFNKLAQPFGDKMQYLASLKNEAARFLSNIKIDPHTLNQLTLDFDNPYQSSKTLYFALYDFWRVMPVSQSRIDFYRKFVEPSYNVLKFIYEKLDTVPPPPPEPSFQQVKVEPVVGDAPPKYPLIDKKQQQALFTALVWEGLIAPSSSRKVDGILGPETRKLLDLFKKKVVHNTSISDKDALNIAQTVVEGKLPE